MIELKKGSIIYISCLSSFATGGTELLHQLGFKLKELGFSVKMYYYDYIFSGKKGDPVAERLKSYNIDYTTKFEDKDGDVIIIPEIAPFLVNTYRKAKPIIWWLSVDFYFNSLKYNTNFSYKKSSVKNLILGNIKAASEYLKMKSFDPFSSDCVGLTHWVQSAYAKDFLLKKGISNDRISYLSDYLSSEFINLNCVRNDCTKRVDRVLYNPMKGIEATQKIINAGKHIEFMPLKNFTPFEVAELMSSSKIYIDFGNHPGKDRIPREAAISGAVIITNKRGSAYFEEDVPIKKDYKIEEIEGFEFKVVSLINDIFMDFSKHSIQFDLYRDIIKEEELKFDKDLRKIFIPTIED